MIPRSLHSSVRRLARSLVPGIVSLVVVELMVRTAAAQDYLSGAYDERLYKERSVFELIILNPATTFMMVLFGAAGLYNFMVGSARGAGSEKKQMLGLALLGVVFLMVCYRWSLWKSDYQHR